MSALSWSGSWCWLRLSTVPTNGSLLIVVPTKTDTMSAVRRSMPLVMSDMVLFIVTVYAMVTVQVLLHRSLVLFQTVTTLRVSFTITGTPQLRTPFIPTTPTKAKVDGISDAVLL